LSQN